MPATPIYTIGYGKREIEDFLEALQANQIQYLLDVRSKPYSRYKPEFSKKALQDILMNNGVRYLFMGDALGGMPDDPACYIDSKVDYSKLAEQPYFRAGIERLHNASRQGRVVALMCAEGKPENCHRSKLIGQTLTAEGIEVLHIDEQGSVISQQAVMLRQTGSNAKIDEQKTYAAEIPKIKGILQQTFGYPEFRPLQEQIIANVLRKRDSLAVMPTGSGKSLCYQLPATLFPGLTVVVSPLISLMEDQVLELREWGIAAAYLNSTLTLIEYGETTARLQAGEIKLLYAAPETLLRPETMLLLQQCPVDCLVIDEAHCISEWGHDFRPEYRQLAGLRQRLPDAITLAVTATATRRVRQDIKHSLGIRDANEFISSFDRKNLVLTVSDKIAGLIQTRTFLEAHKDQAGIIYCATRDQVDSLTAQLAADGYPVLPYHAGMEDAARRAYQRRFRYEDGLIMVATIAFGMGINKSNLRFILHYDLPKNIESYYQQIGRAGRDGLPADCLLLYSYGDVGTIRYFINQEAPELRRGAEMRLTALLKFLDTQACRRIPLLDYFGERYPEEDCGTCDNCLAARSDAAADPTGEAQTGLEGDGVEVNLSDPARQMIICAQETREIFGAAHLINVLRGSRAKKVLQFKHEELSSYGTGQDYSKEQWKHLAAQFVRQGLLERIPPHGSLRVTPKGKAVLQGQEVWGTLPGAIIGTAGREIAEHDPALFEQLRSLRARLASERRIPPYVIFPDRSLIEMATYFPRTPAHLGQIYGVGVRKLEAYAPLFLPVIQAYCLENDIPDRVASPSRTGNPKQASPSGQQRTNYVWEQFQEGASISAIAADLGFKEQTILNHLKKAHEAGQELRLDGLKEASKLSEVEEEQVLAAFDECGTEFLRPVFDAFDGQISYDELHFWRLIYQVIDG